MNHLATLPMSLQLLALLALLALFLLDCLLLVPRMQATLVKIFASLDNSGWDPQLAADHPVLVQRRVGALLLGPSTVRQLAVLSCLWFGWREVALLWVAFPWLFALGLFLVSSLLEWRFPAPSALDPDFQPRVVTAENCAEFGLTPEQVREMTERLLEETRRCSQPDDEPEAGK